MDINVLNNDRDIDGTLEATTVAIVSVPTHGTATVDPVTGIITYTNTGTETLAFLTYTVHDNDGITSRAATVRVAINKCPIAADDEYATNEDTPIPIGSVFQDNGNGSDLTQDSDALVVSEVNGDSANVGQPVTTSGGGTVTLQSNGLMTYDPNGAFDSLAAAATTDDTFTYTVTDGKAGCGDEATVTITITGVNDNPAATDDSSTVDEDSADNAIDVRANDDDAPETGETLTVTGVTQGDQGGVVTFTASGVEYTPVPDYTGPEFFTYDISDGNGGTDTATVTVTVTVLNDPPDAVDDSVTGILEDSTTNPIDVLANDEDAPDTGETLTVTAVTQGAQGGAVTFTATGVDYAPVPDFNGVETFTYTINDGTLGSDDTATVTVTVDNVNDCPVAVDDAVTTDEDSTILNGNVLGDNGSGADSDLEGNAFTVTAVNGTAGDVGQPVALASGALLTLNADGTFNYDPNGAFDSLAIGDPDGTDTFTYAISDSGAACADEATVTVNLTPVNDNPTAIDDAATVDEDTIDTPIDVLANDDDAPETGETLTVTGVSSGDQGGTINFTGTGVTYTPVANFNGEEKFTYDISDGNGGTGTAEVTVTVDPVNDPPTANDDSATVDEDTIDNTINVMGNDNDSPDSAGEVVSITSVGTPNQGGTAILDSGIINYTPAGNFFGIETFTYTINDGTPGSDASATVTVTVDNVNDPPTANDDAETVDEDDPATAISVLTNDDDDPDTGETLTITGVTQGSGGGVVVITGGGTGLTYAPILNYNGAETFTYTINDGAAASDDTATVTVTVNPINDAPSVVSESYDTVGNTQLQVASSDTITGGIFVSGNLLSNDSDVDLPAQTLSASLVTQPANASTSVNSNGTFTFTPAPGAGSPTGFTYSVSDGVTTTNGTVTVTLVGEIWYVQNNFAGGGLGRSSDPFDTLAEAQTASSAGDTIYAAFGDGNTTGQNSGITLKANQRFIGAGVALVAPGNVNGSGTPPTLLAAGTHPLINNSGGDGVTIENISGVTVTGLNIAGQFDGVFMRANAGVVIGATIDNNIVRSAGLNGIEVNHNAAVTSTITLTNNTVTATTKGIFGNRLNGFLNMAISNNTNITSGGNGIELSGGGALTVTSFSGNTIHGNTGGIGIFASNVEFDATPGGAYDQVSGTVTTIGNSGNPVGSHGMNLTNFTGDLFFTDLDIFNSNGTGLSVSGATAVNIGAGTGGRVGVTNGVASIAATNGPSVDLSGTIDLQNADLDSTNSGTTGFDLNSVSDGTTSAVVSAGAGSTITNATGNDIDINGGNATVTFAGNISSNAGRSVSVQNITGDTVTLSGTIADTGQGILCNGNTGGTIDFTGSSKTLTTTTNNAVGLTSNTGATINFTGGNLVINTTSGTGFNATGGAAGVTVQGASNTINSISAGALNVIGTTIGASGFTFLSISSGNNTAAADPVNGIVLSTTGSSGGLTVTGNSSGNGGGHVTVNAVGTAATVTAPDTADLTGGTIQNTTGTGISLSNTANVSLTRMRVLNPGTDGINISTINGFSLISSYISDSSGVAGDKGIEMGDFSTGTPVNGSIDITNSTVGPTPHDNFGVGISSGTSTWSISGSVFDDSQLNTGFNFEIRNATVSSFLIDGSVFQSQFADGLQFQPASGVSANLASVTIQNSSFLSNNIGIDLNHDGTGTSTYKVLSNTFLNQVANSVNFFSSAVQTPTTGGTLNGRFFGNKIGDPAVFKSGGGIGIRININGGAHSNVLVDTNTIRQIPDGRGIEIISRNGTGGTDATVTNNTVNTDFVATMANGGFSLANIFLQSNSVTVGNTLRADVRGNTVPAAAPTGELVAGQLALIRTNAGGINSTFQLVDNAPASPDAASELASHNTGSTATSGTIALIAGPLTAPPLLFTSGGSSARSSNGALSQASLNTLANAAVSLWAVTGLTAQQRAVLQTITFGIADLAPDRLGETSGTTVLLSSKAAGNHWFIDPTPLDNSEFTGSGPTLQASPTGEATGRVDALGVLLHEIGHVLGLEDRYADTDRDSLMYGHLTVSERRLPAGMKR